MHHDRGIQQPAELVVPAAPGQDIRRAANVLCHSLSHCVQESAPVVRCADLAQHVQHCDDLIGGAQRDRCDCRFGVAIPVLLPQDGDERSNLLIGPPRCCSAQQLRGLRRAA